MAEILVCDDDRDIVEAIEIYLTQEGHHILKAYDGEQAIRALQSNPVDLLNPPEGCAFAPRCKNCMKICLRENPPRTDFSETHYAHCFMNQKAEMEGGNTNE